MRINRKLLAVLLGLAVSVIFLVWALQDLDLQQFANDVQSANLWLLLLSVAAFGVSVVIIAWRWQFLLRALNPVPLGGLLSLVTIGYMGNNIYPFRSGEILRIVLLKRNHQVPYAQAATTVVIERIFDGLVMLSFVIVPLAFLDFGAPFVQQIASAGVPLFAVALALFLGLAARPNLLRAVFAWMQRWLPRALGERIGGLGEGIINGLAGLRSPADLLGVVFSSYATWMMQGVCYWLVAQAFGLELGYAVMLLTVGVVNLAGLIPASPGMAGVFEFFTKEVLVAAGVSAPIATSYALVLHAVIWLPPTVAGALLLLREGLGFGAVAKAQTLQQDALPSREV